MDCSCELETLYVSRNEFVAEDRGIWISKDDYFRAFAQEAEW